MEMTLRVSANLWHHEAFLSGDFTAESRMLLQIAEAVSPALGRADF